MFWKENATKLNDNNHQQLKYVLGPVFLSFIQTVNDVGCWSNCLGVLRTRLFWLSHLTTLDNTSSTMNEEKSNPLPAMLSHTNVFQDLDGPWGEGPSYGIDVPQRQRCTISCTDFRSTPCQPSLDEYVNEVQPQHPPMVVLITCVTPGTIMIFAD